MSNRNHKSQWIIFALGILLASSAVFLARKPFGQRQYEDLRSEVVQPTHSKESQMSEQGAPPVEVPVRQTTSGNAGTDVDPANLIQQCQIAFTSDEPSEFIRLAIELGRNLRNPPTMKVSRSVLTSYLTAASDKRLCSLIALVLALYDTPPIEFLQMILLGHSLPHDAAYALAKSLTLKTIPSDWALEKATELWRQLSVDTIYLFPPHSVG